MKLLKKSALFFAGLLLLVCCKTDKTEVCDHFRYLNSKYGCISNDWQFQYNGKWYPATVPGNIHDDLLANDLIPDPFFGANENDVQWVSDSIWTYRLYFDGNCAGDEDLNHAQLVFEGLDTYAQVYLNGTLLKTENGVDMPNNMFRKWTYDVAGKLKKKNNELIVKFYPTVPFDSVAKSKLSFTMPDTRVFTRKAQYQSGWDWGPKLNTCGVWKNVYIRSWRHFKKDNLYVYDTKPTLNPKGTWHCNVDVDIMAEEDMNVTALVHCAFVGDGHQSDGTDAKEMVVKKRLHLQKGENHVSIPVKISDPQLWWPNGMGAQNLYRFWVDVKYKNTLFSEETVAANVFHGLRTIELQREKDSIGESFAFVVNGKSCFMRGADWIPATSYPGTLSRPEGDERYYQLLHDAREVNMNMIRVWGGGIYEDDAFYNYCNQLGLLVWQDFMYACNPYPGDDAFMQNAQQEAVEQVCRLRNHPCIALWCGNNEVHNGLEDWGWQTALSWSEAQYKQLLDDFSSLFEKQLAEVVRTYANNAPYISSSPTYGWGHPECTTHGCSHYWGIWWGEQPFEMYWEKTGRFMSEYGFQSYPEMATIETFTTEKDRNLSSPTMKNHQKHGRGEFIIKKAIWENFAMADGYGNTCDSAVFFQYRWDLDQFAYHSQLAQAYGIAQAVEAHRIQHDKCRGTLCWQLNDCWPVASWSSIDYTGRWKALHYRFKDLYANVAVLSHQNADQSIDLYVVNDSLADVDGTLEIFIKKLDGTMVKHEKIPVNSKSNSSKLVKSLKIKDLKGCKPEDLFVKVSLKVGNKVLAKKVTYFVKPKDLGIISSDIKQDIKYFDDHFEVTLSSPTLQYGVHIVETSGKEVKWSNNYVDLLPGEKQTIFGYYDVAALGKPTLQEEHFIPFSIIQLYHFTTN